ncbi:ALK [Cordylochernes scorpioides]|uniref:receptor protein-tyrosine kinase n=1 Tax=Cordylochernes scorpioides TaxID=51811 RepID=A0ABY6LEA7_9ARAC|nr:ALK [Cordylochernes scorpioides]
MVRRWEKVDQVLSSISQPFQVVLEMTDDRTLVPSHFAVDNLRMVNCTPETEMEVSECREDHFRCQTGLCVERHRVCDLARDCLDGEDEDCESYPPGARCDFEAGDCMWDSSKENAGSGWQRFQGPTPISPRAGPSSDHTFQNSSGHYMYARFTPAKMMFGQRVVLTSAQFSPPPPLPSSLQPHPQVPGKVQVDLYWRLQVRFFYHKHGQHVGELRLFLLPIHPLYIQEHRPQELWRSFGNEGNQWRKAVVDLPTPLAHSYYLQFVANRGLRPLNEIALDDISLSPECFGIGSSENETIPTPTEEDSEDVKHPKRFTFTSCGQRGPNGPSQAQCVQEYVATRVEVSDRGVQRWVVPLTGVYTVFAWGASGGSGLHNSGQSRADAVRAAFRWSQGQEILIVVGQPGESAACAGSACRSQPGGGGGGATSVYLDRAKVTTPLVIAAGGGGLSALRNDDPQTAIDPGGRGERPTLPPGPGLGAHTGPGGGGGLNGTSRSSHQGRSLTEGYGGGIPCQKWASAGGFGGGGGACRGGGGGGGYRGGDAAHSDDNPLSNGQGGTSFVAAEGLVPMVESAAHAGPGRVEILQGSRGCGCQYLCLSLEPANQTFHCVCPPGHRLAQDGLACYALPDEVPNTFLSTILIIVVSSFLFIALAIFLLLFGTRCGSMVKPPPRRDSVSNVDLQLSRLRQAAGARVTEFNPHYDFGGGPSQLNEIPRETLALVKALGQGAFGEVYQGYLSTQDIPVAVKTLPEHASLFAEKDFMLEAIIMSKFRHPNIVKLIGVCADRKPFFIVLELLSGGDLRTFLRDMRPRPGQIQPEFPLTMGDLLKLALDIAMGCSYLEQNRFIHRDIAARNCLLTCRSPRRVAKIADFGLARDIYRSDYYQKSGKVMLPVRWMPPEAFLDGYFSAKTDVWSFGVLLWEVMSLGYMPYPGRSNNEVMQMVNSGIRLEAPTNCPAPVYQIMLKCWHPIAEERPKFATIIERLNVCLVDPDIIHTFLPVFPEDGKSGGNSLEDDDDYMIPIPAPVSNYSLATDKTDLSPADDRRPSLEALPPAPSQPLDAAGLTVLLPSSPTA